MKCNIGEQVELSAGYRGYSSATLVGYEYGPTIRYVIEFSSGLHLSVYEDELEKI